jgi:2-keto-myo-inositol isomerase
MTLVPSLNQATVAQCSTEEFVRICAEEGFDQVELRFEATESYFASRGADEWEALLRDNNIKVASLNSLEHFSLMPDSSYRLMEEKTRFMCSLCSLLDTDLLVVVPSYRRPNFSPQQVVEKTAANLERLARVAEDFGVRLGFEPIGLPWYSVRSWETGVRIVDEVGRDDVGLVVDTWNFYLGENRLDELRATPIEKLWMVHLVDAPRELPPNLTNGHRLLPGEGGLALKEFVGVLSEIGYSGAVSVELFNEELWSEPPQDAVRRSFCAVETLMPS